MGDVVLTSLNSDTLRERAYERALELVWPTRCIVCDEPGELLCEQCRASLPWIAQRYACPNCGAPFGQLTCTECDAAKGHYWETRACISALSFAGAAQKLVLAYKDKGERRLAGVIASIMATALDEASAWPAVDGAARFIPDEIDAVCFVPATAKAYQRRGFDHMEAIARNIAVLEGLAFVDVLARPYGKDQRKLGRAERERNTAASVVALGSVEGCSFLLVDDVITTGSSIRACARALLNKGAKQVTALSLARVW